MKCTYVNNVPLAHGRVTVVMSDNGDKVMAHSCKLAGSIKTAGIGVLLINCGMSDRSFREHAGDLEDFRTFPHHLVEPDSKPQLVIHTSIRGDLVCERDAIDQLVQNLRIGTVIIAGWEWASASWRRKEALLFYLRELMAEKDCAVVVYSQAVTKPVKGTFDRGGIGKLAMMAGFIIRDDASETLERLKPLPPPMVVSAEEWAAAERSAQLLANKINELQGEKSEKKEKGKRKGSKPPIKSEKSIRSTLRTSKN